MSFDGLVTGDDSSAVNLTNLVYQGSSQGAKDAGTYVIAANGITSKNYNITYKAGELEIVSVDTFPNDIVASSDSNLGVKSHDGSPFIGDNAAANFSVINSNQDSSENAISFLDAPVAPEASVVSEGGAIDQTPTLVSSQSVLEGRVQIPVFTRSQNSPEATPSNITDSNENNVQRRSMNAVVSVIPPQKEVASPVTTLTPVPATSVKPKEADSNDITIMSAPLLANSNITANDGKTQNSVVTDNLIDMSFEGFLSSSIASLTFLLGLAWRRKKIVLFLVGLWRFVKGRK